MGSKVTKLVDLFKCSVGMTTERGRHLNPQCNLPFLSFLSNCPVLSPLHIIIFQDCFHSISFAVGSYSSFIDEPLNLLIN